MRKAIASSIQVFADVFQPPGPIIEIGSYYPEGHDRLCNLRPVFPAREYIGCDIRAGHGVDRIEDAQRLSFPDASAGTVLMFEILEHLPDPRAAVAEARRVLREDGLLAVSVPFNYRLHGFPTDYWRFTASGVHQLLAEFPQKTVFAVGPRVKPSFIFAVAHRRDSSECAAAQCRFAGEIELAFRRTRYQGFASAFKERSRDLLGLLLGRADLSAVFYDPARSGGYLERGDPGGSASGDQ